MKYTNIFQAAEMFCKLAEDYRTHPEHASELQMKRHNRMIVPDTKHGLLLGWSKEDQMHIGVYTTIGELLAKIAVIPHPNTREEQESMRWAIKNHGVDSNVVTHYAMASWRRDAEHTMMLYIDGHKLYPQAVHKYIESRAHD